MKIINYEKKKFYPNGVVIGKNRKDIRDADPEDIIRVSFLNKPGFSYDILRKNIEEDAPSNLSTPYPGGAWIVPQVLCTKTSSIS